MTQKFKVGDLIVHATFGVGTIVECVPHDNTLFGINFARPISGHDCSNNGPALATDGHGWYVRADAMELVSRTNRFITEETVTTRSLSTNLDFVSNDGAAVDIRKDGSYLELSVPSSSCFWDTDDIQELIEHLTTLKAAMTELGMR